MIFTLVGNNTFALKNRLDELTSKFITQYGDLALERFDGEDNDSAAIIEGLQSLPFLSSKKMVVIRNRGANKQLAEQIEQIISSIPESTDVVFYEPLTDKRTTFYKTLKSKTQFEEINDLSVPELAKWLVNEAKKQSARLTFTDANYLVERIGTNQELLANELEKLITYNPQISRESIELLTDLTPKSKIFDLLDAAFRENKKKALRLYEEQRAQKIEPPAILAMLVWQLELITLVKLGEAKSTGEIAKEAGVNPFPLNKAAGLANKISREKLQEMVNEAYEMELKSKTKALDLDEALKAYIISL